MEKAIISTLDDAGTTRITIDNSKDAKEFGWSRDTVKQEEVSSGDGGWEDLRLVLAWNSKQNVAKPIEMLDSVFNNKKLSLRRYRLVCQAVSIHKISSC